MSAPIDLIAVINPKAGKTERVVELLQGMSEFVEKNEPGTLKYQITVETKKSGESHIIMLETYKNKAALGAHGSSPQFKAFQKALADEGLVGGPGEIRLVKSVGGFASRL